VLIRQLDLIRRLAPRVSDAARHALSEQADAILEMQAGLVPVDRRDLNDAHARARAALA
jgi:hypothetical protein